MKTSLLPCCSCGIIVQSVGGALLEFSAINALQSLEIRQDSFAFAPFSDAKFVHKSLLPNRPMKPSLSYIVQFSRCVFQYLSIPDLKTQSLKF
jgi:hypothetical protein